MSADDIARLLLRRRQLVHVPGAAAPAGDRPRSVAGMAALEADLAERGHVLTAPLRRALATLPAAELADTGKRLLADVDDLLGSDRTHVPLFDTFPEQVPYGDAHSLFTTRIRAHLAAVPDQPCMMCGAVMPGVRSLLRCGHLVCRHCWDAQPTACCEECCDRLGCPVCAERVTTEEPTDPWAPPGRPETRKPAVLRALHLAVSQERAVREELAALLARRTPLAPQEHDDLALLLAEATAGGDVSWLPATIPLRESKALALGAVLARAGDPLAVETLLRAHLDTATDVLRLLYVRSGGEPGLVAPPCRMRTCPRPLRRLLLAVLDGIPFAALAEDLTRHPRPWKRAAEMLHPFEYAARYPRAALAFAALRETRIDGDGRLAEVLLTEAAGHPDHVRLVGDRLRPTTWSGRLEAALTRYDVEGAARLLAARPGELLRRLNHLAAVAAFGSRSLPDAVVDALAIALPATAPGPLLAALGEIRARAAAGRRPGESRARRVFFPRGSLVGAYAVDDRRLPLPPDMAAELCALLEGEVLDRLTREAADAGAGTDTGTGTGGRTTAVLDAGLARLPVPGAQHGTSAALVAVPRGSVLPMPGEGDRVRLFLHWTQPRGVRVDLDLSVAVYDEDWRFVGLCDYTCLEYAGGAAVHSGDLTSAPAPDGATEYVDLDLPRLARAGARHLAVVVFSYNDVPFADLSDAFAGFLELDDAGPGHATGVVRRARGRRRSAARPGPVAYDPRTVRQRFDLDGEVKIRLALTVDLAERTARWADVPLRSAGSGHNVWRHRAALARVGRDLADAFAEGRRVTLWDLACWRAAARTHPTGAVIVRDGQEYHGYRRRPGETVHAFAARLREREAPDTVAGPDGIDLPSGTRLFSALVHADLPGLPDDVRGETYRLFPGPSDAAGLTPVTPGDLVAELRPRGV